jgi:uncharacterized protein (TIGR03790 family)
MNLRRGFGATLAIWILSAAGLFAGGSGLNVVVVVNQNSTNSVQLGNYYCEKRGVPPQNFLRITNNWTGSNVWWTRSEFETGLLNPLVSMLASRSLTNQVDYIVLSMDVPYRVFQGGAQSGQNSTTAALFYGFKTDDCTTNCPENVPGCYLPAATSNAYSFSEGVFRQSPPIAATSNSWLVTMLTSSNLWEAKAIIDHGVASDGTFPTQTFWLAKSTDWQRNVRFLEFDNTIFDARIAGDFFIVRTNLDTPNGRTNMLGYLNGHYSFTIQSNSFVPGAIADSLTSYGGLLFEPSAPPGYTGHTILLVLLNAGASGSYGTVTEPCAYLQKFPSPQDYFYQARGFSLAECYYQSLVNPYQGLIVGEPLAAPFARPPVGAWTNLPANSVLSGVTNLTFQCVAGASNRPVQQVDLFLDGTWMQTLTNIPPAAGNQIYVTINGCATNYPVPTNATLQSVAAGLADVLNQPDYAAQSKAQAVAYGDRIALHGTDLNTSGAQIPVSVSAAIGSASALTTFVAASLTNLLDTVAYGLRNHLAGNPPNVDDYLRLAVTKTNGTQVTIAITNTAPGTNISGLTRQLVNAINSNSTLQAADGLVAEDFIPYDDYGLPYAEFNLRARTPGWPASQILVEFSGPTNLIVLPAVLQVLDQNVGDLQPRNHLYLTAGVTNLLFAFPLDTAALADGSHELTAVVYEGSHVRTQARVTQNVRIQNTLLNATFTTLAGATNTVLDFTLSFSVAANTNTISRIELFTTGGSAGAVSNQATATFAVAATNLGVGLHPFYAVVTRSDGRQYHTETKWIRIGGPEPPFGLTLTAPPPALAWPATAGRLYEVLSATNLTAAFQSRGTVAPTNSPGLWTETNPGAPQKFYRVRAP